MNTATKEYFCGLSVALLALALYACASAPGGNDPGGADLPAASEPRPSARDAATSRDTRGAGQSAGAGALEQPDTEDRSARRIAPDDLLKVKVAQAEELSKEGRVSKEGEIVMPLIGKVQVGGITPTEAERRIVEMLRRDYLQDPKVSIIVAERAPGI